MIKIFLSCTIASAIALIAFCVGIHGSQDTKDLEEIKKSGVFNPTPEKIVLIEDFFETFTDNGTSTIDDYCGMIYKSCKKINDYRKHIKVQNSRKRTSDKGGPVCAHQNASGLIDFENPCEIALQNCLSKYQVNAASRAQGIKSNGTFFYNGQAKPCKYYLNRGKSLKKAVKLYYDDELQYKKPENWQIEFSTESPELAITTTVPKESILRKLRKIFKSGSLNK